MNATPQLTCTCCELTKDKKEFGKANQAKNLTNRTCRECMIKTRSKVRSTGEKSLEYRIKVRERIRQWRLSNPEKYMLRSIRNRAKKEGRVTDLTLEDIKIPEFCPILGIRLRLVSPGGPRYLNRSDSTPSVDRINPKKGYMRGNIVICSWRANRLKSDGTLKEIRRIYKFMKAHAKAA